MAEIELFNACCLHLAEGEPPVLSAELEAARDLVWERAVAANPALFDGPVVGCAELRREGTAPGTLFLRWAAVTYRHYALRRVRGGRALPSLFVNVVQPTTTTDGRAVVGRMSRVTAAPGRWQLPGGSVEPPRDGEVLDEGALRRQAARELAEEIGVEADPEVLRLWLATRGENASVGLTYLAPALPETELRMRFAAGVAAERAAGREPEFDAITLVRTADDLAGLVPQADYLAAVVGRYANGGGRPEA
ncbi:NUDIX domain-containing protein [Streptomyces sp. RS10V-4]|uniref:NUDIX hydrolase n=1 Tax=Streptomyces rhizoryzae TaxID=2932493 RepID=UPI0020033FFF|nr:NUDIX domain-containing protein [Streptomyces rhizoryzae]MCK7624423.1 NUDIX domain-containing protein [Streptomyces rhizoryzae]